MYFRPVSVIRLKDALIEAEVGQVIIAQHNGENVYKALLSFKNDRNGKFDLCLEAEDDQGLVITLIISQGVISYSLSLLL